MCAINRMPQEILETVFELVRGEDYGDDDDDIEEHGYRGFTAKSLIWVAVTHVCHYWRECAIGMKRLWSLVEVDEDFRPWHVLAAMTFLERSNPLHITFRHDVCVPQADGEAAFNDLYASLDENRDRIAGIFLYGDFHETAWVLLQEDLPNLVEVSLDHRVDSVRRYGSISERQKGLKPLLSGRSSSVRKLRLWNFAFTDNLFPNVTHLRLTNGDTSLFPDNDWNLPILSSLSNTLEALRLYHEIEGRRGSGLILRSAKDQIHLPHLKHVEVMGASGYGLYGVERCMALLQSLSLPPSLSILWSTKCDDIYDEGTRSLQFPPPEYCDSVENIAISLVRAGYSLMEGNTVFGSSTTMTDSGMIRWLCIGLPNVTSISLPSSFLQVGHGKAPSHFTRLIQDLVCYQVDDDSDPIFCPALSQLHVYTGVSESNVLGLVQPGDITQELIERNVAPFKLLSDHSMEFRRDILDRSYVVHFHHGHLTPHEGEYW